MLFIIGLAVGIGLMISNQYSMIKRLRGVERTLMEIRDEIKKSQQ
ncbi:hypothetical protein [Paenibacillus swuensis]|nr:hypothetical protein [Paenibacillus swuensis]